MERDGAFDGLRYDSDGDGAMDVALLPTFAFTLVGPATQDVTPPEETFNR
jgi:hypothetical protein